MAILLWVSGANGAIEKRDDVPRRDRYLLLDSRIIEGTGNAILTVGAVQKDKRNPLFKEDKPWEPRYDNVYCNVIYDEQNKLYKCWYSPFIIDERTTSTPEAERNPSDHDYMSVKPNGREMGVCYAVSKDGIHWEKPELGLVEFNGNKKNNILMRGYHFKGVFTGPHGAGVFKDLHESDLAKRYKMFFKGSKMAVAFSPDGLHWNLPIECPKIDAHGDTHNNAFWAPDLGKYIGITRLKYGRPSIRQVAWTESPDFINWTKAKVVLEGVKPRLQTHDMVVFPIGGVYIGLLGMMDFPNAKSNFHTKQHVELAWSPDSKEWHRIQPGTPFIGHTPAKKEVYRKMPYDWGTIFASAPIFREDEIQIYYGACDWYFFDWRKGYLALGTLRPDGWAGYEQIAGDKPAIITTTSVVCTGSELQICADVRRNGFVKVKLFDNDNKQWLQSKLITRTVTDTVVKWQKGFSIENVKGENIRLKFELKNAKLYSFGFDLKSQAKIISEQSKSIVDSKEDIEEIVGRILAKQRRHTLSAEEQVPGYVTELRDANPRVRENAADELAKIGLQVKNVTVLLPAVAPLVAAMDDDDMEVRDESAEALGNIGSRIKDKALRKFVIDALVRMLSDEDAEVREESAEALGRIASEAKDKAMLKPAARPLIKALQDEDKGVRDYAARALGHIGTSEAKENMVAVGGNDNMNRGRFLLLDSHIVERTKNAKLTVGKVQKDRRNPLFAEDKPWEPRFDNLYANVLYDEDEELYKCWYSPFIIDESTTNTPRKDRVNGGKFKYQGKHTGRHREMGICYAVSRDGIRWEKPSLGIVEFEGSKGNNLVWRGPHGSGIFKDPRDPDPKRRYKAFFKGKMISVGFSPDGIHWSDAIECPEANVRGDTHNNALWAPTLGEYVGITRTWAKPRGRQVARTSSKDFLKWTKADVVLEGIENHLQTYAMPVFYYAGVYIGLPAIYNSDADRTHTELAWSPDTVAWHRIDPGTPLIANSTEKGQYDWGTAYAAAYPVFLKDEIRLYYGGCDDKHFGWRKGYFCLATLRPDGFAGYEQISEDASAFVITGPLLTTGRPLALSADVQENGFVRTRLLDDSGGELASSQPVSRTVMDARVEWRSEFTTETVGGKIIRIEFELKNAKLYSFSFLP
jgi:hypothetical protein